MRPDVPAKPRFAPLFVLVAGILAIFLGRALLSARFAMPLTSHLFETLTIAGSLLVLSRSHSVLRREDGWIALSLGLVIGLGMSFATLFSPYPFLGLVSSHLGQAVVRGAFTAIAALGGLAIMRQGGPVPSHAATGNWPNASKGVLVGSAIGLPLAVLNVYALQVTQGQPIQWQDPLASALDALQPGIVEEVIYRFALWGLLWLVLRSGFPAQAAWLAGLLAMLLHNYSHFDELFLQSPLAALGMGAAMALLWGLPLMLLARRRGLEAAIAFHWLQDVARFLVGF